MATYTHSTPARYTHGSTNRVHSVKGARNAVFLRHLRKARTRTRPTSLLKVAKRVYSESFDSFGGSKGTIFQDAALAESPGADLDHIKKATKVVDKSSNTVRTHG